jgi:hypothetical protein
VVRRERSGGDIDCGDDGIDHERDGDGHGLATRLSEP